jgi:predicted NBD/HSP70 family sugar kinase
MTSKRARGTPVLRRMNTTSVLRAVRDRAPEPVRLTELSEATGLTRPTVGQAVEQLLASGWLTAHAPTSSPEQGGRPALRISLNGRAAPVLGLDVGPHNVRAAVADAAGHRLSTAREHATSLGARSLLEVIRRVSETALSEADLTPAQIAAVAVGTPGIVEAGTGEILLAPSVPGWTTIDVLGHLHDRFRCPIVVENDANLAALAMAQELECHGTLLGVQWGERLGAGVVIDGRLHRGAGAVGEIGFIRPRADAGEDAGDDGTGRGPLERTIGAEAITDLVRDVTSAREDTGIDRVQDAADLFAAAAAGNRPALLLVDQVAAAFAAALAPAILVLSPHALVIGGGLARAGELLLEAVSRHLEPLVLTLPRVALSGLAEDAVLSGAVRVALDQVWEGSGSFDVPSPSGSARGTAAP